MLGINLASHFTSTDAVYCGRDSSSDAYQSMLHPRDHWFTLIGLLTFAVALARKTGVLSSSESGTLRNNCVLFAS
jgi:hypothetical protein